MYLWSAVLYLLQVRLVVTTLPKAGVSDARA
jgi:cardiolipin synthase